MSLVGKIVKLMFFKDVSDAYKEEKDKPLLLKKRVVGTSIVALGSLSGMLLGYEIDEALIIQLIKATNDMQDALYRIVQICTESWPVVVIFYGAVMGIIGAAHKKTRDRIAAILGEPKQ